MEITISEDVQRKLITESLMGDLSKALSNISQIGKENLKDTQKMMKFDLKFLKFLF
jgi:UV DNA damage repair endonuclease